MALQFKISKEDHEALDEGQKALYAEAGDGFQLEVEGLDDNKELKEALRKEREERAAAKKRTQELETAAEQKERERLEAQEEYQSLYQKEKESRAAAEKKSQESDDKLATSMRLTAAERIVAPLIDRNVTNGVDRYEDLREKASKFISHTPEGLKINGPDGESWDEKQLSKHISTKYPWIVDGSKASGGGAPGSNGGGAANKSISRADFDGMSHPQRATYFKEGGKISDE